MILELLAPGLCVTCNVKHSGTSAHCLQCAGHQATCTELLTWHVNSYHISVQSRSLPSRCEQSQRSLFVTAHNETLMPTRRQRSAQTSVDSVTNMTLCRYTDNDTDTSDMWSQFFADFVQISPTKIICRSSSDQLRATGRADKTLQKTIASRADQWSYLFCSYTQNK